MRHLVIATLLDGSCRPAVRAGLALAARAGAACDVVVPAAQAGQADAWLGGDPATRTVRVRVAAIDGLPEIEIPRFAERAGADLLLLARPREDGAALADAILRRTPVPCFVVRCDVALDGPVLAALDGTVRGLQVHQAAAELAPLLGAPLHAVTVDPAADAHGDAPVPSARAAALAAMLRASALPESRAVLHVRHGPVVREVLDEVAAEHAAVLAVGIRRLGPAGAIPEGSVARQLASRAPCAVLAVPL